MSTDPPSADRLCLDAAGLNAFLRDAFPHAERPDGVVLAVPGHVRIALEPDASQLRPGGIVSGPTLMGLADRAAYALVLAHIGPVAMAVTSSLNYQFLRACSFRTVHADARLLRLGRRLVVTDVRLWSDDEATPVGQAAVTYALPAD
ncbi:thioesterase [alpha proteobacterium AAP81b]|nr:thioesterase [alpha proteobacterium AAP81b]